MGNAGRVLMIPKGDYNAATTYEMLDCVYYNGRSYVCKQASTGHAPTDTTYWQPMTPDASAEIQALTNYVGDSGVKNVLPVIATTQEKTGITFTVNADGSITVDGTAEADTYLNVYSATNLSEILENGHTYILSGCPSGYTSADGSLYINGSPNIASVDGSESSFTYDSSVTRTNVTILVKNGRTISNKTFYPMIRESVITDATYQPYAKTNVELTQDVAGIEELLANAVGKEITAATAWSDLENMGTYVMNGVPFTGNWSIVLVLKRNENTGVQIAFRVGNASDVSSNYVAYRMYYTGTWSSWAAVNATNMT